MSEEMENLDSETQEENETLENEEVLEEQTEETESDLEARLKKAEEIANNQRIRAEKAEKALKASKKPKQEETPKSGLDLDQLDEAAELLEIPKEDRAEVKEYAERKGISIAEAKKQPIIQSFLNTQKEYRTSADLANAKDTKRNNAPKTDEQILADFDKGIISEKDEDIDALVAAEFAQKRKEAKN